jgi:hypothetical protein
VHDGFVCAETLAWHSRTNAESLAAKHNLVFTAPPVRLLDGEDTTSRRAFLEEKENSLDNATDQM